MMMMMIRRRRRGNNNDVVIIMTPITTKFCNKKNSSMQQHQWLKQQNSLKQPCCNHNYFMFLFTLNFISSRTLPTIIQVREPSHNCAHVSPNTILSLWTCFSVLPYLLSWANYLRAEAIQKQDLSDHIFFFHLPHVMLAWEDVNKSGER